MREKLRTTIRFYSKSKGKYTQKAYRYFYRYFGVLRGVADEFIDWFLDLFFNKDIIPNTPQRGVSWSIFLVLFIYRTRGFNCFHFGNSWIFMDCMSFWMCVPANAPPVCEVWVRIFMLRS
jgi:hypothetical protein